MERGRAAAGGNAEESPLTFWTADACEGHRVRILALEQKRYRSAVMQ